MEFYFLSVDTVKLNLWNQSVDQWNSGVKGVKEVCKLSLVVLSCLSKEGGVRSNVGLVMTED